MRYRFAAAWRFLTIFPFSWWQGADEGAALRASVPYFPVVGLVLGLGIALVMTIVGMAVPPVVAAALGVIALAAVSGGLHMDGLADSADALLSPGHSREKALDVMKDSRLGAHGAMGLVLVLLLKFACLASLPIHVVPHALLAAAVLGRAGMIFPMALLPYAREKGLGGIFQLGSTSRSIAIACVWAAVFALVSAGFSGIYTFALWLVVTLAWVRFLRKRLNGATGDSYGAACELCETAALLGTAVAFTEIWL